MKHIHTIFVPDGQTVSEQWKELCIFGVRVTPGERGSWANVDCDGDECASIQREAIA